MIIKWRDNLNIAGGALFALFFVAEMGFLLSLTWAAVFLLVFGIADLLLNFITPMTNDRR